MDLSPPLLGLIEATAKDGSVRLLCERNPSGGERARDCEQR